MAAAGYSTSDNGNNIYTAQTIVVETYSTSNNGTNVQHKQWQ